MILVFFYLFQSIIYENNIFFDYKTTYIQVLKLIVQKKGKRGTDEMGLDNPLNEVYVKYHYWMGNDLKVSTIKINKQIN